MLRYTLAFVLGLFLHVGLCAQPPPLPHAINYTVEDGLPSSEVYMALEDSRGYMWFGTDNGVVRYDGYEFVTYGAQQGLVDGVIFSLAEAPDGHIWACGFTGALFTWNEQTDRFTAFSHNDEVVYYTGKGLAIKILEVTADKEIIVAGRARGIVRIDTTGQIHSISPSSLNSFYGVQSEVPVFAANTSWELNNAAKYRELYRSGVLPIAFFDANYNFVFQDTVGIHSGVIGLPFIFRNMEGQDTSYVAIVHNALFTHSREKKTNRFLNAPLQVNCYHKVAQGGFLTGSIGGGGLSYYQDVDQFAAQRGTILLEDCNVSHVMTTQNGSRWVTTLDKGIFYFPNPAVRVYGQRHGLPSSKTISVLALENSQIFITHENQTISEVASRGHHITHDIASFQFIGLRGPLFHYAADQWIWGPNFSINVYTKEIRLNYDSYGSYNNNITKYNGGQVIKRYFGYHPDTLAVVSHGGVGLFDKHLRGIIPDRSTYLDSKRKTISILPVTADSFLIGTRNGLYVTNDFSKFHRQTFGYPQLNTHIEEILRLPDSTLLFGTRGQGLIHYHNDTIHIFGPEEGLASNTVRNLHLADDGAVWVSTLAGISKWSARKKTLGVGYDYSVRSFTTAHGLPSSEVHEISTTKEDVWLASSKGLVRFVEPPLDSLPTPPTIGALRVNGEIIDQSGAINLRPDQNDLEISFATIDLAMRGNIPYRYRLHDDEPWKYTKQRIINLTNLAAGIYHFDVQSRNQDGYWSQAATLNFRIREYWYRTSWFWVFATIALLLTLYLSLHLRQRRIDRERELKEQAVELERAALRAQINPHFIFNCLNSINRFILRNEADNASEYLTRFAHLIRQTLNISVRNEHTLQDEINMLTNYLELEKLRFKNKVNYLLTIDPQLALHDINIPPLLVQPYVENALAHGLSNDRESLVEIEFIKTRLGLTINVIDNGDGIDFSKPSSSKSLGMRLTSQRLALMAKKHPGVDLNIQKVAPAKGTGTKVTISIASSTYN